MRTDSLSIGVIGFGIMGSSMAKNLAKHGHRVLGFSRTQSKVTALTEDGVISASLEEIARNCRHLLLSLTDGSSVDSLLFGENGAAPFLAPGTLIIDTTTIAPCEAYAIGQRCDDLGLHFVDAPVTGGDVGARNATLTVMCGGRQDYFEQALPILQCIGQKIVYIGPSGAGQRMKAVNQIGVALGIVAMTEALVFAEHTGIDRSKALDILQGGAAGSWALSNYAPRLLNGDLQPGFSAAHMLKDLRIALQEIKGTCDLPGTETATALFEKLITLHQGLGNHALVKAYKSPTAQ